MSEVLNARRPVIRTAVAADLPRLQELFRVASLSNEGDAPLLLQRPEFLVFSGDGIAAGRTRVAVATGDTGDRIVGFATVSHGEDGAVDLEDLFVDPAHRRRGVARELVLDAMATARHDGYRLLTVTGNGHALDFYRAVGFADVGRAATQLGPAWHLEVDLKTR